MRKPLRSDAADMAPRPPPESPTGSVQAEAPPSADTIEDELAELERLSLDDLRRRWRNSWGQLAPGHLSRGPLFRILAYRLQAEAFGDFDRKTVRLLDRQAEGAAKKSASIGLPNPDAGGGSKPTAPPARDIGDPAILKPGTLLTREWEGRIECVMVVNEGFAWNGATYSSLSAVAFAITGTKWNGHRFFGVRPQDRARTGKNVGKAKRSGSAERPKARVSITGSIQASRVCEATDNGDRSYSNVRVPERRAVQ